MEIILKKTKEVPFVIEGTKGKFICRLPKAPEFVAFWAAFRAIEGDEKAKAEAQTKLVIDQFTTMIEDITFDEEVNFKNDAGETMPAIEALKEYFSLILYHSGLAFLNPGFGGAQADPLE